MVDLQDVLPAPLSTLASELAVLLVVLYAELLDYPLFFWLAIPLLTSRVMGFSLQMSKTN